MQNWENKLVPMARSLGCVSFLLLAGIVVQGNAQTFTLADGNSVVQVKASSPAGMMNYWVNGANQVSGQWFYYRIGNSGPENPIDTIGGLTPFQSDARSLDLTYGNPFYSARVVYSLTGGGPGSGTSGLNETISFLNKSTTSPLSLSFFDYSDFDLLGGPLGQTLQFTTTTIPVLRTNRFIQTLGAASVAVSLNSGTNYPSHVEAALSPLTLASLTDPGATTLNDVIGPVFGDVTGAFQWDVTLAANSSLTISKLIRLEGIPIPEPATLGLLALGLVAALGHRCRTR